MAETVTLAGILPTCWVDPRQAFFVLTNPQGDAILSVSMMTESESQQSKPSKISTEELKRRALALYYSSVGEIDPERGLMQGTRTEAARIRAVERYTFTPPTTAMVSFFVAAWRNTGAQVFADLLTANGFLSAGPFATNGLSQRVVVRNPDESISLPPSVPTRPRQARHPVGAAARQAR